MGRIYKGIEQKLANEVSVRLDQREARLKPPNVELERTRKNREVYLDLWSRKHWKGPTTSPIDGQTYETREAYVQHLLESDVLPAEVVADAKSKDKMK